MEQGGTQKRILFYDIETTPNLAYVWGKWQQDVIAYANEWELLSFSWKWLGEKEVHSIGRNKLTEEALVETLHTLLDAAEVVVAHNGDAFDQKKSNAKFIEFGLMPPSPYRSVDTKKVAKRYFKFNSNKLDDLGQILGLGRKIQTGGFALWQGCMANDKESWAKMLEYNEQDVVLLEQIYLKFLPWIENHPAVGTMIGVKDACDNCGGTKLIRRGKRYAQRRAYARFRCNDCGHWQKGAIIKD